MKIQCLTQEHNARIPGWSGLEPVFGALVIITIRPPCLPKVHLGTCNRLFPSSIVSLFQNKSKCETFHMNMSSACSFIFMQIKVIFIRMVSHLDSL